MDQLHDIQQSVQMESIGATCLGIGYRIIHLFYFSHPIYCDSRPTLALPVV